MSYENTILGDTPTGYWPLDDSNFSAADASGNSHAGLYNGGVNATGLLTSDPGTAVTLDGSSNITGASTGMSTGAGAWSLEIVMKTTTAGQRILMAFGNSASGNQPWISIESTGKAGVGYAGAFATTGGSSMTASLILGHVCSSPKVLSLLGLARTDVHLHSYSTHQTCR